MLWAGLDLGTTHLKALLYDDRTRRIAALATTSTPMTTVGLHAAHSADGLAQIAVELLASVLKQVDGSRRLGGIAVAGVGEEIVPIDADGNPTGETLAWYDPRGRDEAEAFCRESVPTLHEEFPPDGSFSLFKLLWLRAHRPGELDRCVRVVDVTGFLLMRLGAPPTMDWSHASRTGVFDLDLGAWDEETLLTAGLPLDWFPALVPSGTIVGHLGASVAAQLGISAGTPLVAGGHDHFCGAFASGVRETGELYVSAGTSEAQLVLTDGPVQKAADGSRFDQGRFVDGTHWYVHVGNPIGRTYQQWRDLLFAGENVAIVDAEVARASASEIGVMFHPAALGRGAMLDGVPLTADRGTILRAVVEGSAVASARVTLLLDAAAGVQGNRMVVAGHAAHDVLWRDLRSGLTRRCLELVDEPQAAALGAALLAQRGVTGAADIDAVRRTRFEPSADTLAHAAALDARYSGWGRDACSVEEGQRP